VQHKLGEPPDPRLRSLLNYMINAHEHGGDDWDEKLASAKEVWRKGGGAQLLEKYFPGLE